MIALKPPFRAENMQGLYKKVLKGHYPKISDKFSVDIQTIVRILLQVSPKKRPNCSEILAHAIVKKKIKELFPTEDSEDDNGSETTKNELLKTIYFPKGALDIGYLTDKLPKPSYDKQMRGLLTDRTGHEKSSKSIAFPNVHKSPDLKGSKSKYIKSKLRPDRSVDSSNQHNSMVSGSGEKYKSNQPNEKGSDALSPLERIARRIEQENHRNSVDVGVDNDPSAIFKKPQLSPEPQFAANREPSHKSKSKSISQIGKVGQHRHEGKIGRYESPLSKQQVKSLMEIKSIKGQHKYTNAIISKPLRDNLKDNYKHIEMGVVGEPIIGSTARLSELRRESKRTESKLLYS